MSRSEVVFIGTAAFGNIVPLVEFAKHLISHDQRLSATVLLISFPQRPLLDAYSHSHSATANLRFVKLPTLDIPATDQLGKSLIGFSSLFIEKHKPHIKDAILSLISGGDNVRIAGLVVDMFSTTIIDVANELGIPPYLFFASPAAYLAFSLHLPTLDAELADESHTEFTVAGFSNPLPRSAIPPAVLERKDGHYWLIYHAKRYYETKGIIVNTFKELESYAVDFLATMPGVPPVYPVGPILDHVGPERWHPNPAQQESIMKWLDQQPPNSVVFLCFGSQGTLNEAQIKEIAHGLERAGQRFLWSLRDKPKSRVELPEDHTNLEAILPDGFRQRTAEIGFICGWVPQVKVLAHKAVGGFVSHCGWNSIIESFWYGVPIATWPVYAEQHMNAFELVKELGLAVEISLDYRDGGDLVSAEAVEKGIKKLMNGEDEVRKKVEAMQETSKKAIEDGGSSHKYLKVLIDEFLKNVS